MILELVILMGIGSVVLFAFAETQHKKVVGIFGSIIMIMLGVGIATDGIQMMTGISTTTAGNQTITINGTTNTTIVDVNITDTNTYYYTDLALPYGNIKDFAALLILGLGLFALIFYGLNVLG